MGCPPVALQAVEAVALMANQTAIEWTEGKRALSLTQPWATLVVIGAKRIETRSWKTPFRGRLAIHASKGFPRWARELCEEEPFRSALAGIEAKDLPRGALIGAVTLDAIAPTPGGTLSALGGPLDDLSARERAFGDYSAGRFGWLLSDPVVREPVACSGALGLWDIGQALYVESLRRDRRGRS
jgi:hypothetical protein